IQTAVASEGTRDLADAVCTKVEADAGVFIADSSQRLAPVVNADKGHHEFIGHTLVVGISYPLYRVNVLPSLGVAVHHSTECLGDALPTAVAVHSVVAAVHTRYLASVVLAHLLLKLFEVAGTVGRERVAAIHKGVDKNAIHAILLCHLQQR